MDTPTETTLYSKLAKIMGEVERIPKTGKNTHFNYSFATESDISDAIRKLLAENNIAVFVSLIRWDQHAAGNALKTICDFEFTLACGDTGATRSCLWSGEANDSQDKGFNKAATAAMKYWLLKTFMIPTGDDPDGDGAPQRKATLKQGQRQNPYTSQQPPPSVGKSTPAPTTPAQAEKPATSQPDAPADVWKYDAPALFMALGNDAYASKFNSNERANTAKKINEEGGFANVATIGGAVALVNNRLKMHEQKREKTG